MKHVDILIIDDEKKFADMLAKRIELRGYTSEVCYDGKSALRWIKNQGDDVTLILLDLQLPDLYGTEVLTKIKEINTATPVIILTGHGTEQDRQECNRLGAFKFMFKPLNADKLTTLIEHVRKSAV